MDIKSKAAAHSEPFCIGKQLFPSKEDEMVSKQAQGFITAHAVLFKAQTLIAKAGDGARARFGSRCYRLG